MRSGGPGISGSLNTRIVTNLSTSRHRRHRIRMAPSNLRIRELIALFVIYCATQPPSMTSSLPVTNDASSDARYSTP